MNTSTDPIDAHLASLPVSAESRREALAWVAAGEGLAGLVFALRDWLNGSPSLKPAYRDLHAQ